MFDCAFQPRGGVRSIAWRAHVRMMAAAQPFISGAISKTVNMPRETTPADIADAYREGWQMGLKALAVYRDGSKESQPLSTSTETDKASAKQSAKPRRERLPDTRQSITHKFNVAGHEGYITVGLYEDGRPGELFITMAKEGSTVGGLMDCFGTAVSMSLQYGVPLEVYVNKFSHTRFEPMGHTKNPDIRIAKSIVDYIFRWLGITFLPGYREATVAGYVEEASAPLPTTKQRGNRGPSPRWLAGRLVGQEWPKPAAARAPPRRRGPTVRPKARPVLPARPRTELLRRMVSPMRHGTTANGSAKNGTTANGAGKPAGHAAVNAEQLQRAGVAMTLDVAVGLADRTEQFARFQTDAPSCDNCGAITVRNGNCYLCHNCGNSMGCS